MDVKNLGSTWKECEVQQIPPGNFFLKWMYKTCVQHRRSVKFNKYFQVNFF